MTANIEELKAKWADARARVTEAEKSLNEAISKETAAAHEWARGASTFPIGARVRIYPPCGPYEFGYVDGFRAFMWPDHTTSLRVVVRLEDSQGNPSENKANLYEEEITLAPKDNV